MDDCCWNDVTIIGHKEDLDNACYYNLSFSHFVPIPEGLTESQKETWCIKNWGTKIDHSFMFIKCRNDPHDERYNQNVFEAKFNTDYGPPIPFLKHFVQKYPRCWVKLLWSNENNKEGVFVHYIKNGKEKTVSTSWNQPDTFLTEENELYIPDSDSDSDSNSDSDY